MWKHKYGEETTAGFNAYRTFDKHIDLSVVIRQKDKNFRDLLSRVRNGKITKNDWQTLLKRGPLNLDLPSDYNDIMRLFYTNQDVHEFNIERLKLLHLNNVPIAKIVADHYGNKKAQRADPNDMWGLKPVI